MYSPYPTAMDLIPDIDSFNTPYQGPFNKCQTYACALALEQHHARAGQPIAINRDTLYWMAKFFSLGGDNGDGGATVDNLARGIAHYGVPTAPWNDYSDMYTDPPASVLAVAAQYKGVVIETMPTIRKGVAKDDWFESLAMHIAAGYVPIITFRLNDGFYNQAGQAWDWHQTDWDASYATGGQQRGSHVMACFGIDRVSNRALCCTNWTSSFGDGSFVGMPKDKFLSGPQGCVEHIHIIKACAVQPVPHHNVMTNPVPTALTPAQFADYEADVIAELRRVYNLNSWPGVLGTGALMKLSDKQIEMYGPALDGGPGHGLPRGIIQSLINTPVSSGGIEPVAGLRMETSA